MKHPTRDTKNNKAKSGSMPVMHLWADSFLGSGRVQACHGYARGIYLLLLVVEWQFDGRGLPADHGQLQRLVGLKRPEFERVWREIEQFFEKRDGRLFNTRLEHELEKARDKKETYVRRAKKAANARHGGRA